MLPHTSSAQLRAGGAMLVQVVSSIKPDGWTPTIIKQTKDYVYVEYQSPWLGVSLVGIMAGSCRLKQPASNKQHQQHPQHHNQQAGVAVWSSSTRG
jgi:hypothetical protein